MRNGCYNTFALIFLILSIVTCGLTTGWISERLEVPEFLAPSTEIPQPTLRAREFWTPSHTPTITLTLPASNTPTASPTWTATNTQTSTTTQTSLPTGTATRTFTVTPSSTFTATFTPSITFTPTNSPTITLTPTATGPTPTHTSTRAPFAFEVPVAQGGLQIRSELTGSCFFTGFGGSVFDLSGLPVNGLQVVVTGAGLPATGSISTTGTNVNYSPNGGGWEVKVAESLSTGSYTVQLRNVDGTPLSAEIDYTFAGTCEENLVLIRFQQVAPY